MHVRPARPEDEQDIARIYHAGWHQAHANAVPPAIAALRTSAAMAAKAPGLLPRSLVAVVDGAIAGFVAVHGPELGQLFLDPEWQGHGVARALLAGAEDAMHRDGVREAVLFCVVGNTDARGFYEHHGWSVAATEDYPAQLDGGGTLPVPVWRMVKRLA